MNQSNEVLQRNYLELKEHQCVLENARDFFAHVHVSHIEFSRASFFMTHVIEETYVFSVIYPSINPTFSYCNIMRTIEWILIILGSSLYTCKDKLPRLRGVKGHRSQSMLKSKKIYRSG